MRKNRDVIKESLASLYKSAEKFELYFDGKYEIKLYDNNSMDLFLTTVPKDEVNGDVNRDGSFGIADAVTLQQWLLGSANVSMKRWKAADFNTDDKLDVFDQRIIPDVGTCDMAEWHILVELDKNAEICSEADYKINFTK